MCRELRCDGFAASVVSLSLEKSAVQAAVWPADTSLLPSYGQGHISILLYI